MRWISTVAGTIAAAAAVLVMVSLPAPTAGEAAPQPPGDVTEFVDPAPSAPPVTVLIEDPIPELPVSGLDQSVSDALIVSGYTEFVGEADLGSELDPAVAQVLTDEDAVLVIADDDPAADGGEG